MYDPMQCSINLSSRNLNKTACIRFKNTNCCFIIHYFLVCLMLIFNLAVRYAFFIEKFKSWWRSCFRNTNCCLLHYTMLSTVVPCCSKKRCTVLQLKLKTIAPKKINAHTSTPHVSDFQHILILLFFYDASYVVLIHFQLDLVLGFE